MRRKDYSPPYLCVFNAIVAIREDRVDPDGGLSMGFTTGNTEYRYVCLFKYVQNKLSSFFNHGQSIESFPDAIAQLYFFFADAKGYIPSRA